MSFVGSAAFEVPALGTAGSDVPLRLESIGGGDMGEGTFDRGGVINGGVIIEDIIDGVISGGVVFIGDIGIIEDCIGI